MINKVPIYSYFIFAFSINSKIIDWLIFSTAAILIIKPYLFKFKLVARTIAELKHYLMAQRSLSQKHTKVVKKIQSDPVKVNNGQIWNVKYWQL